MSGRSTTLISYEPANSAADNEDVDTGQLAKLQEKVNISSFFGKGFELQQELPKF